MLTYDDFRANPDLIKNAKQKTIFSLTCKQCSSVHSTTKKIIYGVLRRKPEAHNFCCTSCATTWQNLQKNKISFDMQCAECGISVKRRKSEVNKSKSGLVFCSRECSASYNNKGKQRNEAWCKETFGDKKPPRKPDKFLKLLAASSGEYTLIRRKTCTECSKEFWSQRTGSNTYRICCSDECSIMKMTKNSRRVKRHVYRGVRMDSSWEVKVAEQLDAMNISWIRPPHLKWIDKNGKLRKYFPDFYIPLLDLYLDPKNPVVQRLQQEKLAIISQEFNLVFGSVEEIILVVTSRIKETLVRRVGFEPTCSLAASTN